MFPPQGYGSPSRGESRWGKIGVLATIIGTIIAITVSWYLYDLQKEHDQHFTNSTDLGKTIALQTITETYDKGQPYSLRWTDCGPLIHETTQNGDTKNWMISFTPILLDKSGNPALIQFNTEYQFALYDGYSINPKIFDRITILSHRIDPSNRTAVLLNLTKIFSDVEKLGPSEIRITLTDNGYAPYLDKTGNNLVELVHDKKEHIMTDVTYLAVMNTWIKSEKVDNSECDNLFGK